MCTVLIAELGYGGLFPSNMLRIAWVMFPFSIHGVIGKSIWFFRKAVESTPRRGRMNGCERFHQIKHSWYDCYQHIADHQTISTGINYNRAYIDRVLVVLVYTSKPFECHDWTLIHPLVNIRESAARVRVSVVDICDPHWHVSRQKSRLESEPEKELSQPSPA